MYNSNFRSVSTSQANKNIRKNVQHMGTNKCAQLVKRAQVNHMLCTPEQRGNISQYMCYNVHITNRLDTLAIDDNSQGDICGKVFNNVQ